MNLEKKLNKWVGANIIDDKQKEEIIAFEKEHKHSSNRASYIFLFIGVLTILFGVIMTLKASWWDISNDIKLFYGMLILVISALLYVKYKDKKEIFSETMLTVFFLGIFAYVCLIVQVFNLSLAFNHILLLWVVITFSLLFISKYIYIPFIWTGAFIGAIIPEFYKNETLRKAIVALGFDTIPLKYKLWYVITAITFLWLIIKIKNSIFSKITNFYYGFLVIFFSFIADLRSSYNGIFTVYEGLRLNNNYYFYSFIFFLSLSGGIIFIKKIKFLRPIYSVFLALSILNIISCCFSLNFPVIFTIWNFILLFYLIVYAVIKNKNWLFNTAFILIGIRIIAYFIMLNAELFFNGSFIILLGSAATFVMAVFIKYKRKIWLLFENEFKGENR